MRTQSGLIVVAVLAGLVVATVLSWSTVPRYASSTQLFVSAAGGYSATAAYDGNLFAQQRVASYADLLTGAQLAQQVVDDLHLPLSATAVAAEVTATPLPDTVVLDVRVTDTSPERAQAIAASLGRVFGRWVEDLETPVGATGSTVKVNTIQDADLDRTPIAPDLPTNLWRGAAVGLVIGLALAWLRIRLDRTVRSATDLTAETGAELFGTVDEDPRWARNGVLTATDRFSRAAQGYREIRTLLERVDAEPRPRVLAVTSAVAGEGKTTVAVNLAIEFARTGSRVLLIDGNLRRPRVARFLGLREGAGLTDVLTGTAEPTAVAQSWLDRQLAVLPAGPMPPNPGRLLGSTAMRALLDDLRETHDVVIVDTPPVLSVDEASVLCALADASLIVARFGKTGRDQLASAAGALARAGVTVLGVVLNRVPGTARVRSPRSGPVAGAARGRASSLAGLDDTLRGPAAGLSRPRAGASPSLTGDGSS